MNHFKKYKYKHFTSHTTFNACETLSVNFFLSTKNYKNFYFYSFIFCFFTFGSLEFVVRGGDLDPASQ